MCQNPLTKVTPRSRPEGLRPPRHPGQGFARNGTTPPELGDGASAPAHPQRASAWRGRASTPGHADGTSVPEARRRGFGLRGTPTRLRPPRHRERLRPPADRERLRPSADVSRGAAAGASASVAPATGFGPPQTLHRSRRRGFGLSAVAKGLGPARDRGQRLAELRLGGEVLLRVSARSRRADHPSGRPARRTRTRLRQTSSEAHPSPVTDGSRTPTATAACSRGQRHALQSGAALRRRAGTPPPSGGGARPLGGSCGASSMAVAAASSFQGGRALSRER